MAAMPALQQSPSFAAALSTFGTPLVSCEPVVMRRAGTTFASRIAPDHLTSRPRIINGEIDDASIYRAAGYRQIITPVHLAEWDLTGDLRAGLHQKWRNQLRRAEKDALRIRDQPWDGTAHPLFTHAEALAKARKFRPLPTALLSVFAQLNPDQAIIFEGYAKGHLDAAILVLRHGATATLQTAWTSPLGRQHHAQNLLLFHAAQRLAHLGHDTFDLGPVETDHAPGLARFKLRTGARLRRLGGTWIRI